MGYTGVLVYEWDEHKRSSSLLKHGLDFVDCAEVFAGLTISRVDDRYDYGERRLNTIGVLGERVVNVVHTVDGELVRIISFRRASKNEQAYYRQAFQNRLEAG